MATLTTLRSKDLRGPTVTLTVLAFILSWGFTRIPYAGQFLGFLAAMVVGGATYQAGGKWWQFLILYPVSAASFAWAYHQKNYHDFTIICLLLPQAICFWFGVAFGRRYDPFKDEE